MFKLFISTLGWINKQGSEEEAVLPRRERRSIPKTVIHGVVTVTIWKSGNNSGATVGKPVGIVNVMEWTKSIRKVVMCGLFGFFFHFHLLCFCQNF